MRRSDHLHPAVHHGRQDDDRRYANLVSKPVGCFSQTVERRRDGCGYLGPKDGDRLPSGISKGLDLSQRIRQRILCLPPFGGLETPTHVGKLSQHGVEPRTNILTGRAEPRCKTIQKN